MCNRNIYDINININNNNNVIVNDISDIGDNIYETSSSSTRSSTSSSTTTGTRPTLTTAMKTSIGLCSSKWLTDIVQKEQETQTRPNTLHYFPNIYKPNQDEHKELTTDTNLRHLPSERISSNLNNRKPQMSQVKKEIIGASLPCGNCEIILPQRASVRETTLSRECATPLRYLSLSDPHFTGFSPIPSPIPNYRFQNYQFHEFDYFSHLLGQNPYRYNVTPMLNQLRFNQVYDQSVNPNLYSNNINNNNRVHFPTIQTPYACSQTANAVVNDDRCEGGLRYVENEIYTLPLSLGGSDFSGVVFKSNIASYEWL